MIQSVHEKSINQSVSQSINQRCKQQQVAKVVKTIALGPPVKG